MANAYSIVRQYGDYIEPFDMNFLASALEAKQTKFDANMAKLQALTDQFANVDLLRQVDKDYMNKRLGALVDSVNGMGGLDLSNSGVTRAISSHIKKALDEPVLAAIASTQAARNTMAEIEYYKKEKPEYYAEQNAAFATQGLRQYASSDKLGETYGGESYIPYHDYQKEMTDLMDNLDKFANVSKVTRPDGTGYFISQEGKTITEEEVRSIAEGLMSTQAKNQLRVDGWYNFSRLGPETTTQIYDTYINSKAQEIEGSVASAKFNYDKNPNASNKAALDRALNFQQSFVKSSNQIRGNTQAMGEFLQTEKLMGGLATKYAFTQFTEEYSTDMAYFHRLKAESDKLKDRLDSNGDGIPDIQTRDAAIELTDDWSAYDKTIEEMESFQSQRNANVQQWFDKASGNSDMSKIFAHDLGKEVKDLTDDEKFFLYKKYAKDSKFVDPNYLSTIKAQQAYENRMSDFTKSNQLAMDRIGADIVGQAIKQGTSYFKQTEVLVGDKMVNINSRLKQLGIDPDAADAIQQLKAKDVNFYKAIVTDAYASRLTQQPDWSVYRRYKSSTGELRIPRSEYDAFEGYVYEMTGQRIDANDYFTPIPFIVNDINPTGDIEKDTLVRATNRLNTEKFKRDFPEAYDRLTLVGKREGPTEADSSLIDRSLGDGEVESYMDNFDSNLEKYRNEEALHLRQDNARLNDFVIQRGTTAAIALQTRYSTEIAALDGQVELSADKELRLINKGNGTYSIGYVKTEKVDTNKYRTELYEAVRDIPASDLPPEVLEFINASPEKSPYDARSSSGFSNTNFAVLPQSTESFNYQEQLIKKNFNNTQLASAGFTPELLAELSSYEGIMNNLSDKYGNMGSGYQLNDMGKFVQNVLLSNPDPSNRVSRNFDISANPNEDRNGWNVTVRDAATKVPIWSYNYDNPVLGGEADLINIAPNFFLYNLLDTMMEEIVTNPSHESPIFNRLSALYLKNANGQQQQQQQQPTN